MMLIEPGHIPVAVKCNCTPRYAEVSKKCPLFCMVELNEAHLCSVGDPLSKRCVRCASEMRVIATKNPDGCSDYKIADDVREAIRLAVKERRK